MKPRPIFYLFLLPWAILFLSCGDSEKKSASNDGFSTELLDRQLDSVFDKNELMGMSALLITDGKVSYRYHHGLADFERKIPITENTVYRVASISKSITAVALLQLWEAGKVDLKTDVSTYLDWKLVHPEHPDIPITLAQLLSHQSGIRDGDGYYSFSKDMVSEKLDIEALFSIDGTYYTEDLFDNQAPGDYFSYTNCTWGIIVSVIENVSGQRFDDYCRQHIFEPLGMRADFNVTEIASIDSLAALYQFEANEWVAQADDYKGVKPETRAYEGYELGKNGLLFGPQGSLRSSADDLACFALMLMNEGTYEENQILKKETAAEMLKSKWLFNGENGDTWENFFLSYGYGMHQTINAPNGDIIFPDRTMVGHPGIAYGLLSDMYFDKKHKSGIVFITNGSKKKYEYGERTSFYQVEEDVFAVVYPFLKNMEVNGLTNN